MILAGHQPNYLPYIGFFHKAMHCDVFEFTDHVQYTKKEWQNRNKIRTKQNWIYLTVPVLNKNKHEQKINEVRIDNTTNWAAKHWKSLQISYGKAPFFRDYEEFFEKIYSKKWEKLVDLNLHILTYLFQELRIKAKVIKSSDLNIQGKRTDLIIEICQKLHADTYLSGINGHAYLKEERFQENKIQLTYQEFVHPIYKQVFELFLPYMSVLDLMFNYGSKDSRKIIVNSSYLDLGPTL